MSLARLNFLRGLLADMGKVQVCRGIVQDDEAQECRGKRRLRLSVLSEVEEESEAGSDAKCEEEVRCIADMFVDFKINLDLTDSENKVWLQKVHLFEFASLPWHEWQQNTEVAVCSWRL